MFDTKKNYFATRANSTLVSESGNASAFDSNRSTGIRRNCKRVKHTLCTSEPLFAAATCHRVTPRVYSRR